MKKVGIYSGSFDPIHEGHVTFAREAIRQCGLEKVFFLVEPRPRRKQGVRAMEHRGAMVSLAISDDPALGSIVLQQQRFTIGDTMPVLHERFKGAEIYLLMGDDQLVHFADWPHVDELLKDIHFAIAAQKYEKSEAKKRIEFIKKARGLDMHYTLFDAPHPEISSSKIRLALKKAGTPKGVAPEVLGYIQEQGLYTMTDSSSRS